MISALLSDVGDGMAAGIGTIFGKSIQIDCGSQQSNLSSLPFSLFRIDPDVFILSHFHSDHYNGLLKVESYPLRRPHLSIENVAFPRIPEFDDRPRFLRCLFAINCRVLGGISGSMELDFLNVLSMINSHSFKYKALSAGETLTVEGSNFEILWPPRDIKLRSTIKAIKNAITDFDSALEKDERLRTIYEELENNTTMRHYYGERSRDEFVARERSGDFTRRDETEGELPDSTIHANKSLRAAANHFSLAFHEDNRLLFLGDLENYELNQVVRKLIKKGRTHFQVIITPHHGTHWHSSMNNLKCISAFCSVGGKLFKNLRPEYKEIAVECYATYFSGDVHFSHSALASNPPRHLRNFFPYFL